MTNPLKFSEVEEFIRKEVELFHSNRLNKIKNLSLDEILERKNPFLFCALGIQTAEELVNNIVNATISSSEETTFGNLIKRLAHFILEKTYDAKKSEHKGIHYEFEVKGEINLVSVRSGIRHNKSNYTDIEDSFKKAKATLNQSGCKKLVRAVLGIAYGKEKRKRSNNYSLYVAQQFWHFISGSESLYIDIIEPIGYMAKEKNEAYHSEKAKAINLLVRELLSDFCLVDGGIDWQKLVRFNSGNMEQ